MMSNEDLKLKLAGSEEYARFLESQIEKEIAKRREIEKDRDYWKMQIYKLEQLELHVIQSQILKLRQNGQA